MSVVINDPAVAYLVCSKIVAHGLAYPSLSRPGRLVVGLVDFMVAGYLIHTTVLFAGERIDDYAVRQRVSDVIEIVPPDGMLRLDAQARLASAQPRFFSADARVSSLL